MAQMTPLRRRMIDNMTGRNLSPATQQSYVYGEPSSAVSSAFRWIPYITLAEGQEPVRSRRRPGGTERFYGAGGEEMATSSLHATDGVPQCPSLTT